MISFDWKITKFPDPSGTDLTFRGAPHMGLLALSGLPFQDDFGNAALGETGPTDYNSPAHLVVSFL